MRYIEQFREGMRVSDVYLCKTKQHAVTKNGKEYASVLLQDKTGTVDCKIWDLSSPASMILSRCSTSMWTAM